MNEEMWKMRRHMTFEIDGHIISHICNWPKEMRAIYFETPRALTMVDMRTLMNIILGVLPC